MDTRMQVTIDERDHRLARDRAAELGISLAEYIRRLLRRDLAGTTLTAPPDVSELFGIGDSGGSDVAANEDRYIAEAIESGKA